MGGLDKVLTQEQQVPPEQQHRQDQAPGRTLGDVLALQRSAPLLRVISPEMVLPNALMTRGNRSIHPSELVGVWPAVLDMNLHVVEHGRFFTPLDEEKAHSVCVIGTRIRDELFGSPEEVGKEIVPLGEKVQINGLPFTIVGMFENYESESDRKERELKKNAPPEPEHAGVNRRRGWGGRNRSSWAFERKNRTVYMPLNTMWLRFRSSTETNSLLQARLSDIDLKVQSLGHMGPALQQARNVLLVRHQGIEDFNFQTAESSVESINQAIHNARMSGGIIAAISLVVGGIGIMNIMLASITERIREIGIRKAVGASTLAIFIQILMESVAIAMLGGVVGMAASYGLVHLLVVLTPTSNAPVITPEAMAIAFLFSVGIGVLAGLIPALKAAKLDPIQALRYD
jgi:putative ABC transport system permease protein